MSSIDAAEFARYRDALRSPLERLASCGRPSIAAIDGRALGGGSSWRWHARCASLVIELPE